MDDYIKDLEAIPLPDITDIAGTDLDAIPETNFEGLDLPTVEDLGALELEMLPELERIELEMLPELDRLEMEALDFMDTLPDSMPAMDHPLQAKRRATAAGRDPGEDQMKKGGTQTDG